MADDEPEADTSVGDEDGSTPEERDVRGRRSFYGCYLLVWGITILPFFLLGAGFAGGLQAGLRAWVVSAAQGNIFSIVTLVATLPLLTVPWWLWAEGRRPR